MLRFCLAVMSLSIAMSLFTAQLAVAQTNNVAYGAYGLYPVGSTRVLAMGGAFTGLADDSSAVVTNPAGLGFAKHVLDYTGGSDRVVNREVFFGPSSTDREGLPYTSKFSAASLRLGWLALGASYSQPYVLDREIVETVAATPVVSHHTLDIESLDAGASLVFFKRVSVGATVHSEKATISHKNTGGSGPEESKKNVFPTFGVLFKFNNRASAGASYTPERRYNFDEALDSQIVTNTQFTEWFHDVVIPGKLSLGLAFQSKKNLNWVGDIDVYQPVKNAIYVGGSANDEMDYILEEAKAVLHGGFEYYVAREKTLDFIWRGGGYREPQRVKNSSDRFHFTMGIEVRYYYIVLAASYDQAPGFSNVAQSVGLSLGDL